MDAEPSASVDLPDGRVERVTADDLWLARASAPAIEGRVQTVLKGERFDLLTLLEAALDVTVGTTTLAQARHVARALGLTIVPAPKAKLPVTAPYELRSQLARLSGMWVAIAADRVIAHDPTLSGLLAKTVDQPATVAFVPVADPSGSP